ncbi:hypothetical protein [Cellulosimicrobium sp. CUA-896]|uniref:hypothetical protein n=1 Tax=Cellulosimicrobium sp. CUA-896 TaxID=1517881 RepID=UPI00095F6D09|nr:hypothetical protein [Cellulosimicrobium sp. CUA-896]OLT54533.1 hypothetical protein BJF88_08345 [Cellulosimicrobium sp. CUA-896]
MADHDLIRSVALGSACTAFVTVPTLGPLVGGGEQTARYDTVITPPDYAFVIWAPIFAGCAAATVAQVRPAGRTAASSRRTGWLLAGAFATNTAWSVAAQTDRFALTPALLPVATAFAAGAHSRLQGVPPTEPATRVTAAATGLLLGWTAVASAVNVAAGALLLGARKTSSRTVTASTVGLLGVSAALAGAVARTRTGALPLAAGPVWALATTAATRDRPGPVRAAAAVGALAIAAAARRSARGSRRGPAAPHGRRPSPGPSHRPRGATDRG